MTRKTLSGLLILVYLFCSQPSKAQDSDKLARQILFDQKKQLVMKNIDFTDEEAKFFGPVFEEYQDKLFEIDARFAQLITAYVSASKSKSLTDDEAAIVVGEYFDIQKNRVKLLDRYALKLANGLPPKKVLRYLQLENRIDISARYQLVKEIPLAE